MTSQIIQPRATLAYWIADVLYRERERLGVSRSDMAAALGVSDITLKRLEDGVKISPEIEARVAAYAWMLGLEDARDLWAQAVEGWYQHGSPPQFRAAPGPAGAFAEAIRQASLRWRQGDAERTSAHDDTPKVALFPRKPGPHRTNP